MTVANVPHDWKYLGAIADADTGVKAPTFSDGDGRLMTTEIPNGWRYVTDVPAPDPADVEPMLHDHIGRAVVIRPA